MYRLVLLLSLGISTFSFAQDGNYSLGARTAALSGSSVTIADHWSVFNNPGALGSLQESSVFASYQNRYNIPGFHVIGGGFAHHHPLFNAGIKYFKFGDDLFSHQTAGVVLANRFQMVSLGLGVNVIQLAAEGLQVKRAVAFEFGGTAELTKKLIIGAHIYNINHRELYPTTMKAGITLKPLKPLRLNAEVDKQLESREKFKTGLEYQIIEKLFLRTGMSIQGTEQRQSSVRSTFGCGFAPAAFIIDYAFSNEPLGAVHEISFTYKINKP